MLCSAASPHSNPICNSNEPEAELFISLLYNSTKKLPMTRWIAFKVVAVNSQLVDLRHPLLNSQNNMLH